MLSQEVKNAIEQYHYQGYSYRLIHYLLERRHNFKISFSYLQKKLIPSLGLKRRGCIDATFEQVCSVALFEICNGVSGSEQLRKTLLMKYRMRIPRALSRGLVFCMDKEGVERRRAHRLRRRVYISKGPNYTWHLDGYDKLAPFGIFIHGCIDGFSRKIIWLQAAISNRKPEVIAKYLIDAVEQEGGFPKKIRGDHGTENILVARMVREVVSADAFNYGKSTSNQRIERWWGYLRQARADFWIHEFKLMEADGIFSKENPLHKMCLQFAFLPFIESQLYEVKEIWNSHQIRRQRNGDTVAGIPDILHTQNELHGLSNYLRRAEASIILALRQQYQQNLPEMDRNFLAVVNEILNFVHLPSPNDLDSFQLCRCVYHVLVDILSNMY